jgi:hypothetical protein
MKPVAGKPEVAIQVTAQLRAIAPHIVVVPGTHSASMVQHLPDAAKLIEGVKIVSTIGSGQPLFALGKVSAHHAVSGIALLRQVPPVIDEVLLASFGNPFWRIPQKATARRSHLPILDLTIIVPVQDALVLATYLIGNVHGKSR